MYVIMRNRLDARQLCCAVKRILASAGLLLLVSILSVNAATPTIGADAVVLVNSHSAKYLDFQHYIQPYLDNFGFPYTVQDISTNPPGFALGDSAVIIIGHSELDTNLTYLSGASQSNISLAVSNGTGLVNFDNNL